MDILKTVTPGVPDKGMPAWGKTLKPDQVIAVAAYVLTLRGTTPPRPRRRRVSAADSAAAPAAGRLTARSADPVENGDHR